MSIKSIKIKNLLSFNELIINDIKNINCIVGKNNTGKSNLLKLIRFFYNKLENKRELPPLLNSKYSTYGTITITYDTSRINKIVSSDSNIDKSNFFKYVYNILFNEEESEFVDLSALNKNSTFELTLYVNSDESTKWSVSNKNILKIINYIYPFFDIETRHINLHDWDKLWLIISRLKSFNINNIKQGDIINFFDEQISGESNNYKEYITKIQNITKTNKYNYKEKVLNYVKAGIKGQTFLIDEQSLDIQSDGTNSHRFIEIALELLLTLSRRDYINPTIYIDEPEIGLHPKRNEELIYRLYEVYNKYKKTKQRKEKEKYKTPYPTIVFSTHSPNIVKEVIKLFDTNQQILHFSKNKQNNTVSQVMNSTYEDKRFLNIFSDNEARLFFSNFILFVEGATEEEVFSNRMLIDKFKNNKGQKFLHNIDIYATNDVILKYINPSYANTSIPYLVVYDADKIINIDFDKNLLHFKHETINLITYLKMYQKSYIGSKKYSIYFFLQQLINWQKSFNLELSDNLFEVKNYNYNLLIQQLNDNILLKENYILNRTTIENVLINEKTFCMFKQWLFFEFKKAIDQSYNIHTPSCRKKDIRKKKILEIRKFNRFINENFETEKEKMIVFILIFDGKSETTISTFTENYKHIDLNLQKKITKIKKEFFRNKKSLNIGKFLGKTSGWATEFLNFSINKIEQRLIETDSRKRDQEFKIEFKIYFEELYDIITIIEKKI